MQQSFLKSKAIYERSYASGAIIITILFLMLFPVGVVASAFLLKDSGVQIPYALIGLAFFLFLAFLIFKSVSHNRRINKLLERRRYLTVKAGDFNSQIFKTVVHSEFDHKEDKLRFKIIDDQALIGQAVRPESVLGEKADYRLYDMKAEIFREGKHGKQKVAEKYYTILEIKLRKAVPHLVFDSVTANKQQFQSIYVSSQKLEASASFDKHFTLYSPKHHSIETLSFITPEVIEAMINLRDCDFEFIGDSLFCYAPLLNETELAALRQRGLLLHAKVNDNLPLHTFTDTQVDEFGRQLLKNPWRLLPTAIFSGLLAIGLWVFLFYSGFEFRAFLYAAMCTLSSVGSVVAIINRKRKNEQLEAEFLQRRTGR